MTTIEERTPLDHTDWLLGQLVDTLGRASRLFAEAAAVLADVDLGLAEAGVDHQQAFPPCGAGLRAETVTADELILGDRAVPVEHMVVGPEKDAFRHFHRIDGVSAPRGGQVVLGWGSEDRVVACDWPFARVTTGRVVTVTEDGPEAYYEWEQGR